MQLKIPTLRLRQAAPTVSQLHPLAPSPRAGEGEPIRDLAPLPAWATVYPQILSAPHPPNSGGLVTD
ncbi:MAG: hypothetical protein VKJ46_00320, partial [Leptolyngbyaceae bacterium]|nr:hypothetical protein [Leptolyngbyaceae bacterium]